jgi:hypothetical protein
VQLVNLQVHLLLWQCLFVLVLNDFFFCLSFWPIRILSACTCVYNYRVNSSIEESVSSFQQYSVISVKIHVLWKNIIVVVMHALFHSEIGISLTK